MASDASRVVERIRTSGVLAILQLPSPQDFVPIVEALHTGGVRVVEWALGEPERLRALETARARFGRTVLIGAGTVLTVDEAKEAIRAGAQFLTGPTRNSEVLRMGLERDVPTIPSAFTATEIAEAWAAGASLVKVFPAGSLGPGYVRDLQSALPDVPLVPSGGVTLERAPDFIAAGADAVGLGRALIPHDLVVKRAYAEIEARARGVVEAVQEARTRAERSAPPVMPIEGPDIR